MFKVGTKVRIVPSDEKTLYGWGGVQDRYANEVHTVTQVFPAAETNFYILEHIAGVFPEEILDDQNRKRSDRI